MSWWLECTTCFKVVMLVSRAPQNQPHRCVTRRGFLTDCGSVKNRAITGSRSVAKRVRERLSCVSATANKFHVALSTANSLRTTTFAVNFTLHANHSKRFRLMCVAASNTM